jgi:hypothetical protein
MPGEYQNSHQVINRVPDSGTQRTKLWYIPRDGNGVKGALIAYFMK